MSTTEKTILIITDNLDDQVNGVVTTFKNITKLGSRDGYSFVYITPRNFSFISCPGYPEVKLSWPKGIGAIIEKTNPSYIHIATEGPVGLAGRLYCDKKGYIYNTSYHTKFPEFLKKIYGIPLWMTYWYVRWFHKHSGRVLTTTDTMVQDLQSHGFKGRIGSWTRGVDTNVFAPAGKKTQNLQSPLLVCVGRVSKEKGVEDFCKLDIGMPCTKVVVGDGPYRHTLENRYPEVDFVGVYRGKELAKWFQHADVFVFPSRNDTFGIVIIEALACGTPVAAYPVMGPLDILEQGVDGYMDKDLNNAVLQSLKLNRSIVYEKSRKWTWQRCWEIFRDNLVRVK